MAVKNFGGNKFADSVNYGIRGLPDGRRAFMTECGANDQGAVQMTRTKDGIHHKVGDIFYCKGGNAIGGLVKGLWVRDGYQTTVGKELNVGFSSVNEEGKVEREFLKLSLVSDDGRIDTQTAAFLAALNKAELGEEITLAVHTFTHKAGDLMNKEEPDGKKWDKDGYTTMLKVYQEHLKTDDNPHGGITVAATERYVQPSDYVKGKDVIELGLGEKPPVGIKVQYDAESAAEFYSGVVASVTAKVGSDHKFDEAAKKVPVDSDDDRVFGGEQGEGDDEVRTRMANRPS
jgi:hypothetical protein